MAIMRRRSPAPPLALATAGLLVAALVPQSGAAAIVASASTEPPGPDSTIEAEAEAAAAGDVGPGCGVETALAEVPSGDDASEPFQVTVADLDAATEVGGVQRPDGVESAEDIEGISRWLLPLMGVIGPDDSLPPVYLYGAESLGMANLGRVDEFDAELGWSVVDVDRYVEFAAPPRRFAVMEGDFGSELDAPGLDPDPAGIITVGEGDELEFDPDQITAARPLGAPLYVALRDGRLATSTTVAPVTTWLEGSGPTLADDDALVDVARALDAGGCVSALMVRAAFTPPDSPRPLPSQAQAELDATVRWEPFDTVGIGWSADGDHSVVEVVYGFADEQAATDSVDGLRTVWTDGTSFVTNAPFSEYVSVESADVAGRAVTVRLRPSDNGRAQFPLDALFQRDVAFLAPPAAG